MVLLVLASLGLPVASTGYEAVQISAIMADPGAFQTHFVTLQGRAQDLSIIPLTSSMKCGPTYNAYTFKLDDGTGVIEGEFLGNCWDPNTPVPFADGDLIVIEGQVLVMDSGGGNERRVVLSLAKATRVGN